MPVADPVEGLHLDEREDLESKLQNKDLIQRIIYARTGLSYQLYPSQKDEKADPDFNDPQMKQNELEHQQKIAEQANLLKAQELDAEI